MIAPRGMHHLAIQVRDLALAERFYCSTLGLPVLRRWPADGGGERSLWVDTGDGSFLALERTTATAPVAATAATPALALALSGDDEPLRDAGDQRAGLHLIALRIAADERRPWQEHLRRVGVAIYHRTPFTLYVRDPEGNRVGLSHYPALSDDDVDGDGHGDDAGDGDSVGDSHAPGSGGQPGNR